MNQNYSITVEDLFFADIELIDFSMIKLKLQDEEEGVGWTKEECNSAEEEYKKFLLLKRTYPKKEIVPHKEIDVFWHQHILDTAKYAEDCENIFGYFLHHYPYFGMNGEQDKQDLVDAFEETKLLYKRHFHKDYIGMAPKCKAPKCRTACKPMKCR
ncbi:MAG: glycine-rich domain-containing protein-like [Taibaiella sp.]|nr:glycine-rich domain-containing protein-like [Taibaiella sp.]